MAWTRSRPRGRESARPAFGGPAAEHATKIYGIAIASVAAIVAFLALTSTGHVIDAATQHFMLYYAGVFALIGLCASVALGLIATDRMILHPGHRIFVQSAHRAASFGAVAFLVIHIVTEILAQRVHMLDAAVPFLSPFRTFYIGLGTIASDLLVLLAITGILRKRFTAHGKAWRWRAIHYTSYVAFVFGVWHGLLGGRPGKPYVDWSYGFVVALVALGLAVRILANSLRPKENLSGPPVAESASSGSAPMRAAAMFAQLGIVRAATSTAVLEPSGPQALLSAPVDGWTASPVTGPAPAYAALPAPTASHDITDGRQPLYEPGYEGPPRYLGAPRNSGTGPMPGSDTGPMPRANTGPMPRATSGPMPRVPTGPIPQVPDGSAPRRGNGPRRDATSGPMPRAASGPLPRAGTGPMPQAGSGPIPRAGTEPMPQAGSGPLPRAGTGPMPRAATGPLPRAGSGPLPRAGTGPVPRAQSGPMPAADLGPAAGAGPGTGRRRAGAGSALGPGAVQPGPVRPTTQRASGPMPRATSGPMPRATSGPMPRATSGPMPRAASGPMPRPDEQTAWQGSPMPSGGRGGRSRGGRPAGGGQPNARNGRGRGRQAGSGRTGAQGWDGTPGWANSTGWDEAPGWANSTSWDGAPGWEAGAGASDREFSQPPWEAGAPVPDPSLRYREPGPGMPGYRGSGGNYRGGDDLR